MSEDTLGWATLIITDLTAVGLMFSAVRSRRSRTAWVVCILLTVVSGNVIAEWLLTSNAKDMVVALAWQAFLLGPAVVFLPRLAGNRTEDAREPVRRKGGGW